MSERYILPPYASERLENQRDKQKEMYSISYRDAKGAKIELSETNFFKKDKYSMNIHSAK